MISVHRNFLANLFLVGCFLWLAGFVIRDSVGHSNLLAGLVVAGGALVAGGVLLILTLTDSDQDSEKTNAPNPFDKREAVFLGFGLLASVTILWHDNHINSRLMWPLLIACGLAMASILILNKFKPPHMVN